MSDDKKKFKVRVKSTAKGDISVSLSGDLSLDKLVDRAIDAGGRALNEAFGEAARPEQKKKRVLEVAPAQGGGRGRTIVERSAIPDLTEEDKAKREPPLTRKAVDGPKMCRFCGVRIRDCAENGNHRGGDVVQP